MRVPRKPQLPVRSLFASCLLALSLVLGCDVKNPCDPNQMHVQGACVAKTAPTADAGKVQDSGPMMDSSSDAACTVALDASLGTSCTTDKDCDCAAPYCAIMPGQTTGICTITHCTVDPDSCPSGYVCFDLSVFGVKGVPTFCSTM